MVTTAPKGNESLVDWIKRRPDGVVFNTLACTETDMTGLSKALKMPDRTYADPETVERFYAWLAKHPKWRNVSQGEWDNLLAGKPDDMLLQNVLFERFLEGYNNET